MQVFHLEIENFSKTEWIIIVKCMYTMESLKSDWTKGFKEFLKKSKNNLAFALVALFMYCDCECVYCNNI